MSVNFPSEGLFVGYTFEYNAIKYIVAAINDGVPVWSAKGINVDPSLYIAKSDEFAGDINGSYGTDGSTLSVIKADDADTLKGESPSDFHDAAQLTGNISDARLPDTISSNITGSSADSGKLNGKESSHYTNADNIDAGTLDKQYLPSEIDSNTSGNAASADVADKVANKLTIEFYGPGLTPGPGVDPTSSVEYDGETTAIMRITDTDSATAVIDVIPGDGLGEPETNKLAVNETVARTGTGTSADYVVSGTGNTRTKKLKASNADNADKLDNKDPSHYLDYNNLANKPTIPEPGPTYTKGSGIDITNDAISCDSTIARVGGNSGALSSSYAKTGTSKLRAGYADNAGKLGTVDASSYATKTYVTNEINKIDSGGSIDVADLGADIHWDDLIGDNDVAKFEDFRSRVAAGTNRSLFVPGGVTINLNRQFVFPPDASNEGNAIGLVGPPAALGRDRPKIKFDTGGTAWQGGYGLWCQGGIRARNFVFDGAGSGNAASRSPGTLIYIGGNDPAGGNEDDIDSSFLKCDFGEKNGGGIIVFNGRNVNVGDCAFSNMNEATGILMEWDGIEEDNTKPDQIDSTSWRKNRIYNNQFHGNRTNTFIQLDGDSPVGGLLISGNIVDLGARFFYATAGGCNGLAFTGNSWYGRTLPGVSQDGVLQFTGGAITAATISGNTFSGFNTASSNRPNHFIQTNVVIRGLAITGNCFAFSNDEAIDIQGGQASRVTVTGNSFWSADQRGDAFTDGCIHRDTNSIAS